MFTAFHLASSMANSQNLYQNTENKKKQISHYIDR